MAGSATQNEIINNGEVPSAARLSTLANLGVRTTDLSVSFKQNLEQGNPNAAPCQIKLRYSAPSSRREYLYHSYQKLAPTESEEDESCDEKKLPIRAVTELTVIRPRSRRKPEQKPHKPPSLTVRELLKFYNFSHTGRKSAEFSTSFAPQFSPAVTNVNFRKISTFPKELWPDIVNSLPTISAEEKRIVDRILVMEKLQAQTVALELTQRRRVEDQSSACIATQNQRRGTPQPSSSGATRLTTSQDTQRPRQEKVRRTLEPFIQLRTPSTDQSFPSFSRSTTCVSENLSKDRNCSTARKTSEFSGGKLEINDQQYDALGKVCERLRDTPEINARTELGEELGNTTFSQPFHAFKANSNKSTKIFQTPAQTILPHEAIEKTFQLDVEMFQDWGTTINESPEAAFQARASHICSNCLMNHLDNVDDDCSRNIYDAFSRQVAPQEEENARGKSRGYRKSAPILRLSHSSFSFTERQTRPTTGLNRLSRESTVKL